MNGTVASPMTVVTVLATVETVLLRTVRAAEISIALPPSSVFSICARTSSGIRLVYSSFQPSTVSRALVNRSGTSSTNSAPCRSAGGTMTARAGTRTAMEARVNDQDSEYPTQARPALSPGHQGLQSSYHRREEVRQGGAEDEGEQCASGYHQEGQHNNNAGRNQEQAPSSVLRMQALHTRSNALCRR